MSFGTDLYMVEVIDGFLGLMLYDCIINIEKDISLVWRYKRVTLLGTLYIATRYLWLVFGFFDIATIKAVDNQVCIPDPVEFSSTTHISGTKDVSALRVVLVGVHP